MKKFSLISIIVVLAMVLAACGGGADTSLTPDAGDTLGTDSGLGVVTEEVGGGTGLATEDLSGSGDLATEEIPTMESTETGAMPTSDASAGAGTSIPSTGSQMGEFARLDDLMDLDLLDSNGGSLGSIQDFVISVPKMRVDYLVVDRGGQSVLVPWSSLAFDRTNNAGFNFNGVGSTFDSVPAFSASDFDFMDENWDQSIIDAWRGGNTASGTSMPSATDSAGTSVPTMDANSGSVSATQMSTQDTGDSNLGTGEPFANTVYAVLASELENMNVVQGANNTNTVDNGAGMSTQAAGSGTQVATSQVDATPAATSQNDAGNGSQQGESLGSIVGAIVNVTSGDLPYLLLSADGISNMDSDVASATQEPTTQSTSSAGSGSGTGTGSGSFADSIPVPFRLFNFVDENTVELPFQASVFSGAPVFSSSDFSGPLSFGWDSNFQTFWEQNGTNP